MSCKILSYILDDSVTVVNPKFVVSVYSKNELVVQYGAFMIFRNDLLNATLYALHINKKAKDECEVHIHREGEKILNLRLINPKEGMETLKAI